MSPKISIIVPVYNVEAYLDRCVKSLLSQTIAHDIEIILVDDGSPDNCPQLCDDYAQKHSNIKVIHKKNAGLGMARNSGIEAANGEYITFCDSDDWIDSNAYETIYNECVKQNLDICTFQHRRIDLNGKLLYTKAAEERSFLTPAQIREYHLGIIGKDHTKPSSKAYEMSSCMALFRSQLLKESGIRYPSEREIASEDLIFLINFLPHVKRIAVLPNVFYNYTLNPLSISSTYSEAKYHRLLKLIESVNDYCHNRLDWEESKHCYYSQLLRIIKVILKYEVKSDKRFFAKISALRNRLKLKYISAMLDDITVKNYGISDRIYLTALKYRSALFFYLLYKIAR